jgi:transcriptional regulator with XRE-family HTH domain
MSKTQHSRKYDQLLKALRQTRKKAGLTQLQVAKKLGVYASYISKCESGERRIDVIELADFCRLYGVLLNEFLQSIGLE